MAGKGGRTAAVVGWCLLLLSLTAPAAQGALSMTVSYPQKTEGNFSHVNLTCGKGSLGDPLTTATFARDDSGVYSDIMEGSDDVVSMVDIDGATVEFVFNQSQEGAFSCESDGIRSPDKILAASPPRSATGPKERYVLFPSRDSNRTITLSCGVRPGRESNRYSVAWERTNPFELFEDVLYDVAVNVNATGPSEYRCTVTIQHSTSETKLYQELISVNKRVLVLSTLAEDAVVAVPVSVGTVAMVTCKIIKKDTNFSISWRMDGRKVCDEDTPTDDITCFTNATHGVLQLENTTSLGVGNHTVECVLEQDIDPLFIEDPSFEDEYEAVVVRSGVLEILQPVDSPSQPPSLSPTVVAVAAGASVIGFIFLAVVVAVVIVICCCCLRGNSNHGDPDNKRQFRWNLRRQDPELGDPGTIKMVPMDPHVSPNKQFHAGDTPLLIRQNANQPNAPRGAAIATLDVMGGEDGIYNGSMNSGRSGISGLSEEDSMSCPPSPAVSGYQGDDDVVERSRFVVEDDPARYVNQERTMVAPSISVVNEPELSQEDIFRHEQLLMEGGHVKQGSGYSHHSSSHHGLSQTSYTGIPNLFGESEYRGDPTSSLGVPNPRVGSSYSVHSEPITGRGGHGGRSHRLDVQSEHGGRSVSPHRSHDDRHRRRRSPSSHHSHSDQSDRSGYHSDYIDDGHHHHHHHDDHRHRNKHRSKSGSRSPKFPSHPGLQATPPMAQHYLSHHTIPTAGRAAAPMRESRSEDFRGPSGYHRYRLPSDPPSPPLSDTESWVRSTQRLHADETQPPLPRPSNQPQTSSDSSDSSPREAPPTAAPEIIDGILLEAVGCLMHQENCRIHRCPCREVKKRFQHLMPQARIQRQQEADRVMEDVQRGRFDPSDRRQQMRISLSSQNISPDIHPHYHMTSRSHITRSKGAYYHALMQRRRSKSMDLTPVQEQPGESCATTPNVIIPENARGFLCGPAFSPAITPSGETIRVLSPTTPSSVSAAPPVLLREISLSADNLPSLCLNDCPMAATPLMQLANRPLGAGVRSPLSVAQQRWNPAPQPHPPEPSEPPKDSPSSDEGHGSDRYTSQDSSSSLQTNSTHSSGKTEPNSVFVDSTEPQLSLEDTAPAPDSGSLRRHDYQIKGRQDEIEMGERRPYQHLESGYSTTSDITDPENSLSNRSRAPPTDLPLKTRPFSGPLPQKPAPPLPQQQPPPPSSREQTTHLVPVVGGNRNVGVAQRRGSTSSHGSHHSVASHNSHVSVASDGSFVTQTLC